MLKTHLLSPPSGGWGARPGQAAPPVAAATAPSGPRRRWGGWGSRGERAARRGERGAPSPEGQQPRAPRCWVRGAGPGTRWRGPGAAGAEISHALIALRLWWDCFFLAVQEVFTRYFLVGLTRDTQKNSVTDGWTPAAGVRTPRLAPQHSNMSSSPQAASALPAPTCTAPFLDSELQEKFFLADVNEASSFCSC